MREFLEIIDPNSFLKLAENANFVVRVDPIVFVNMYGLIFYIDLSKLDKNDVRKILQSLKDKLVIVEKIETKHSILDFLSEKISFKQE